MKMHTLTVVLLPRETSDLWQAVHDLLQPHRIDWDDPDKPSRLDYLAVGAETIADEESAMALGVTSDEDLVRNVCFVSRLRPDFVPGAVVTPDGRWYDRMDYGWLPPWEKNPANAAADAKWMAQVCELFATHGSCVAVEIDTHS